MTWSPDKIPIWLRRTPEQQASDDALQLRLKTAYGPGSRPNPTERHLMRARAVELSARAQLNHLKDLPDADPKQVETASAQLAEARAAQGHYVEASKIHPSPEHAARFSAIAAAVLRPDDDACGCQDERAIHSVTGKQVVIPVENIDEMVFDPRYGKLLPLVVCRACGHANVTPKLSVSLEKRMSGIVRR